MSLGKSSLYCVYLVIRNALLYGVSIYIFVVYNRESVAYLDPSLLRWFSRGYVSVAVH